MADWLITPVVDETSADEEFIIRPLLDWHELHSGDAERGQMLNDRGARQSRVRAAEVGRNIRMELRQALDMGFVNDGVGQWYGRRMITLPVKRGYGIYNDTTWGIRRRVQVAGHQLRTAAGLEIVQRWTPVDCAGNCSCVRIEQQHCRIESQ